MDLISHLPTERRRQVETRLRHDLIAWLTSVRPDGQPVSVPVWFLVRDDGTILIYSQPGKVKLRNIAANPRVSLTLDGTDLGRDVVRIEGVAATVDDQLTADREPAFQAKYSERIQTVFGTSTRFAELYSVALVITPTKLRA
ncbi:PPOX class probable F420-dependent enzyme [Krasilnikovia cinnamomea]|uniref:PPOX class probable F420-dependent enzyme n=1 Tax=Krasilnikovia cinnamomea TaxID=349313 RepID=A0A4Q7ZQI4_9ACTN|nr:TIGR03667 family PPOX class F420-dependent oxidoreductase [Krasilnikovia cinnamomea]RZU53370.1 PPOX class probable F420-dependent enzyme [Krasilnikovia cinnamomea]